MGWTAQELLLDFQQRQETVVFFTELRPVLGPIQPPLQWVLGFISLAVKRQGREADEPPHLEPRSRIRELYLHYAIRLYGVVLN
jgi:hypothetical protein